MLRLIAAFILGSGLAYAQPVFEVSTRAEFDEALEQLEFALNRQDLALHRQLDISAGLAGRGVEFMPFTLALLAQDDGMRLALAEDPDLASFIPPTVYAYSRSGDEVRLGVLDIDAVLGHFELSAAATAELRASFVRIYAALGSIGALERGEAASRGEAAPYFSRRLVGWTLLDASDFLEITLQGYNVNVVERLELESVTEFYACSLAYGEILFRNVPALAAAAPCRVYAYPHGEDVVIGTVDLQGFGALYPAFNEEVEQTLREADDIIRQTFTDLGAE